MHSGVPWATVGNLDPLVTQTFAGGSGYTGLDRFGRVQDLWFTHNAIASPPDHTLLRHQYTYDPAGNRTSVRLTRGASYQPDRSYYYLYDGLERLTEAQRAPLIQNGLPMPSDDAAGYSRWNLDILGNWTGNTQDPAGRHELAGDGSTLSDVRHQVDAFNRITEITENGVSQAMVSDPNGNLVFDGTYVYQYDAWNRLTDVNLAGSLVYTSPESTTDDFDEHGRIAPAQGHAIGSLVLQMVYDGVGRLIQVRRPVPLGQATSPPRPLFQIEDYYYDGVRRIQEVVATETGIGTLTPPHTEREYIYGPEYVDEFIAQIDDPAAAQPTTMYVLQDANYNVSALLTAPANPQTQAPTVLAEYTYDPYGQPVYANEPALTPMPRNTIGHQGLFFYRLDFKTDGTPPPAGPNLLSPMHPQTTGLYYNRNRWYSPKLGRFTSPDPNETAAPIISALLMNAESASVLLTAFNPLNHFMDGMNVYAYQRSNPLHGSDPLGLDMFDEIDDWTADRAGNAMYMLGALNEVILDAGTALKVAASFLPGAGLYDAFQSVQLIANGKGGFWDAMNIAMAAFPLAKGASKLLGLRSLGKAGRYLDRACNCFVADTLVDTSEGQRPIESPT